MSVKVLLLFCLLGLGTASRQLKPRRDSLRLRRDFLSSSPRARTGRQVGGVGIDFSNAIFDEETGKRCVIKEEEVQSLEKTPVLECTHKETEQCHYTYVTKFTPSQEEVCEENFQKQCQITFKQQATNETIRKCYRPIEKICNGQGEEVCKTIYESSCTTKYVEKQPGKFVGDTACEKLPIEVCGAGCVYEEGEEECHDKVLQSLVDVPEEVCDLNPQKTCRLQTKLVPRLTPKHECTRVPREVCSLRFKTPKRVSKPLLTKWCLDDSPVVPGELYEEDFSGLGRNQESARSIASFDRKPSSVQRTIPVLNLPLPPQQKTVPAPPLEPAQRPALILNLPVQPPSSFPERVESRIERLEAVEATNEDLANDLILEAFGAEEDFEVVDQTEKAATASPISILSSGEDDDDFLSNFKTQEFADFVDFANF